MDATSTHAHKSTPLRRNLQLCMLDGVAAMPLAVLSQPGNAVIAALLTGTFALSTNTYGLISSLPFWFNFLQVLLTPLLAQRLHARSVTIASAWMLCAGWIALFVALPFLVPGETGHTRAIFIVIFSLMALSNALNGVAWNSWMQECIPVQLRGSFFGLRNRMLYISLLVFMLIVSGLLAWFEGSLRAFQLLIAGAIGLRVVSVLAQQRMLVSSSNHPSAAEPPWREQVGVVWRDVTLVRFIVFASLMGLAVNLFSAFYPVFMFSELHLSVARVNMLQLLGVLGAAIAFPAWGRLLTRFGNIPVMIVSLVLWQLFNSLWCFQETGNLWLLYVIMSMGGLFSAGYGIGLFGLLLKLTPPGARTMGMALFVSVSSLTAAVGPIIGGYALNWAREQGFPQMDVYHVCFAVMPILVILNCFLLRRVSEANSARVTDVVGAMRSVRTIASLFGLTFLVNQVFLRPGTRPSAAPAK